MTSQRLREEINNLKVEKRLREEGISKVEEKLTGLKTSQVDLQESQQILQVVGQATQKELEYHVSELVSLALEAVFPDPYKMALDFVLRRNKSEADFFFVRKGQRIDPLTSSGGGPVDVASFALRVSLWSLQSPRSRSTIILDEPFRFLSRDLQDKASQMLEEISKKLDLQIIIVTHEVNLLERADTVITVTNNGKQSLVESD